MEKNWKERAKSLIENDFFMDFDEDLEEAAEVVNEDDTDLVDKLLQKVAAKKAFGKDFSYDRMEIREVSRNYWPGEDVIGVTLGVYVVADAYNIEVPEDIDEPDVEDLELEDATFDDDTAIQAFTHGMTTDIDGYSIIFQEYEDFEILGDKVDIDWNSEEDGYVNGTVDGYVPVILSIESTTVKESIKKKKAIKEGFYKDTYDMTKDKISEEDLYKALVTDGELISLNAGNTGEAVSFKDGGVYCDTTYEVTEYDGKFSIAEFYNSDDGDWKEGNYYFETDSFETLCAELQRIFPNALIECKMTEDTHAKYAKPEGDRVASYNNALKYAKKDDKPYIYGYLNGAGKFFALEQPIKITGDQVEKEKEFRKQYTNCKTMYVAYPDKNFMEEIELTADELKDKYGTDDVDVINAGKEPEERVALKEAVEVVYAWTIQNDIYGVDWCSVEESDSEPGLYDGTVFLTASEARNAAVIHLRELEEEGELEGEPSDYSVGTIDYPTGIISDETLEFSNIVTEDFKEPDNAVVDCKVNKVIAHCEDEKPVDCLGKKKPLEKPLTEEASEIIYLSHALREEIAICACDLDKIKQLDMEACKIYEDAYDAGLVDGAEEEQKLCSQYGVKTFSRADLFDMLTKNAKVDWDAIEWTYQKEIEEDTVDGLDKKKPLGEDFDSTRAAAQCSKKCYDFYKAVADKAPDKELKKHGRVAYKFVKDKFGLTGKAAEDLIIKGYVVWKQLNWNGTNEALKEARSVNELNEGGQTPEAKAWQDANCYKWNAYAVINGKRKSVACTYEPKEINPDTLIASVRRIAAHKLNLIMSECYFLKKPFTWDGNLEITRAEFGAEPEYITTLQIKRQGDRDLSQIPEL